MYSSKYYTCEEIDERLLQGYYNDAVAAGYQGTKEGFIEGLRNLLENPQVTADNAILLPGTGLNAATSQQAFTELANEVFPLEVTVGTYTDTYEVGTANVKPQIPVSIKRHGEYVDNEATIIVSPNTASFDTTNHKIVEGGTFPTSSVGSQNYILSITHKGQTKPASAPVYARFYAYYGDIGTSTLANAQAVKEKIESSWRNDHKKFSTKTDSTLITSSGTVTNVASHYYLFAVQGSVNLVVRDAATNGIITGCPTGSGLSIARVNDSGNDNYSWVIIPASSSSWNFKITNL